MAIKETLRGATIGLGALLSAACSNTEETETFCQAEHKHIAQLSGQELITYRTELIAKLESSETVYSGFVKELFAPEEQAQVDSCFGKVTSEPESYGRFFNCMQEQGVMTHLHPTANSQDCAEETSVQTVGGFMGSLEPELLELKMYCSSLPQEQYESLLGTLSCVEEQTNRLSEDELVRLISQEIVRQPNYTERLGTWDINSANNKIADVQQQFSGCEQYFVMSQEETNQERERVSAQIKEYKTTFERGFYESLKPAAKERFNYCSSLEHEREDCLSTNGFFLENLGLFPEQVFDIENIQRVCEDNAQTYTGYSVQGNNNDTLVDILVHCTSMDEQKADQVYSVDKCLFGASIIDEQKDRIRRVLDQ